MNVQIEESWKTHLQPEFEKDYFRTLTEFVKSEYSQYQIFPPGRLIFNAFNLCPFDKVKVVIIGQDRITDRVRHTDFVSPLTTEYNFPPSLVNIFKEIKADIGTDAPTTGKLNPLGRTRCTAAQRNTDCTCTPSRFSSKPRLETFTDAAIRALAESKEHLVFILWGSYAQKKGAFIDRNKHLVLTSAHPSPLSAYNGFFGNKHFSRTNDYLKAHGETEINW